MLKLFHIVRIFNLRIFLVNFTPDFKHVVFSYMNELLGLLYMVGKLEISSF